MPPLFRAPELEVRGWSKNFPHRQQTHPNEGVKKSRFWGAS
jgi:hypothetical protein